MNWADERVAFELRVQTNFNTVPVQYQGVATPPPANAPWVRMVLLPGIGQRITLGPNAVFREFGTLLFMIFVPINTGTAVGRAIADELSNLFHEAVFEYGGSGKIRMRVPGLNDRGTTQDGSWYQLNLDIEYQRDVVIA